MAMEKESLADKAQKPVSNKAVGAAFILIAFLVVAVGFIAYQSQMLFIRIEEEISVETVLMQLDLFIIEYFFVGLFAGIFLVLGVHYMKSPKDVKET